MQTKINFEIEHQDAISNARTGKLRVNGHVLLTPNLVQTGSLMNVLTATEISAAGSQIIKQSVLKWWLRFGDQVKQVGDLHQLLGWSGLLLTASGADEVYQWAKPRGRKKNGVSFRDPQTGQLKFYSPRQSLKLQQQLGSDLLEGFSRAVDYFAPVDDLVAAGEQTIRWQQECQRPQNMLAPLVGGGLKRVRQASVRAALALKPVGYSINGISVDVSLEEQKRILGEIVAFLPQTGLRYLPTSGSLKQLLTAIACGVDLVDSDLASREASMGNAMVDSQVLHLDRDHFAFDRHRLLDQCSCATCQAGVSRAYLHHLLQENADLAKRLLLVHNLTMVNSLVNKLRQAINENRFTNYWEELMN